MSKVRDIIVIFGVIILVIIGIMLLANTVSETVGVKENAYRPEPHEVWKVYFIDYDENGEELLFVSGAIVEWYVLKGNVYTIGYLHGGEAKTIELNKNQDFLYIEVLINYDMLK